ncbi:hypothetical protein ACFY1U_50420 [Streptomyces sp. NPDC001351]|uniref:hypothetical protein n=1 Tax=Streptomyces sp. NPDC001351 TaxID=3364564 RepID=UPI0036AF55EE
MAGQSPPADSRRGTLGLFQGRGEQVQPEYGLTQGNGVSHNELHAVLWSGTLLHECCGVGGQLGTDSRQ